MSSRALPGSRKSISRLTAGESLQSQSLAERADDDEGGQIFAVVVPAVRGGVREPESTHRPSRQRRIYSLCLRGIDPFPAADDSALYVDRSVLHRRAVPLPR